MGNRWAIGDIHGCIRTFRVMVEEKIRLAPGDTLFILGDMIDRGPDSKAVVDFIIHLQEQHYQVLPLMGNHEYLLINALYSSDFFETWMLNSGITTLQNFKVDIHHVYGLEAVRKIPGFYLTFFGKLPLYLETDGFFLVHAGLNPLLTTPVSDVTSLLWTRDETYHQAFLQNRILVHGHTPIPADQINARIMNHGNRIWNIDGGCVYPFRKTLGNLVAVNLDNRTVISLKNLEEY